MVSSRAGLLRGVCALMIAWSSSCMESGVPRTLPSGRVVEVLSSGVVIETPRLWGLRYRSQLPADDRKALDAEAMELWAEVQPEADASGAKRASLWPVNLETHIIHLDGWRPVLYTTYSFDFQFEKDEAGVWKHVPHEGRRVDTPIEW